MPVGRTVAAATGATAAAVSHALTKLCISMRYPCLFEYSRYISRRFVDHAVACQTWMAVHRTSDKRVGCGALDAIIPQRLYDSVPDERRCFCFSRSVKNYWAWRQSKSTLQAVHSVGSRLIFACVTLDIHSIWGLLPLLSQSAGFKTRLISC